MAYQALGRGTSANDGTGDDLRTGAGKLNANFVEVYTKLGDGSTLTADTVTLNSATQTLTNKSLTSPTITGTGAIAGASLTATAHFQLPAYADATALAGIASPVAGMMVYQTDTNKAVVYNGTSWNDLY